MMSKPPEQSINICLITFALRGLTAWDDSLNNAIHFLSEDSTGTRLSQATVILLTLYVRQITPNPVTQQAARKLIHSCPSTAARCSHCLEMLL